MLKQRDARDKGVCFYYDELGRLEGKTYHDDVTNVDSAFCTGSYDVAYTYDSTTGGNKGIGRRTGMDDESGSAAWVYDARGRTISETKSIDNVGSFVTQWGYDPAGRLKAIGRA